MLAENLLNFFNFRLMNQWWSHYSKYDKIWILVRNVSSGGECKLFQLSIVLFIIESSPISDIYFLLRIFFYCGRFFRPSNRSFISLRAGSPLNALKIARSGVKIIPIFILPFATIFPDLQFIYMTTTILKNN